MTMDIALDVRYMLCEVSWTLSGSKDVVISDWSRDDNMMAPIQLHIEQKYIILMMFLKSAVHLFV